MAELLKGAAVAAKLKEETLRRGKLLSERGITPTLCIVRSDERDDTVAYERSAVRSLSKLNLQVKTLTFPGNVSREEYLDGIQSLNRDNSVHGVLVLSPLPRSVPREELSRTLKPQKDVDGITPGSLAGVFTGSGEGFPPCTAEACLRILEHYKIPLEGRRAVVLGRSLTVGRPAAMLLMARNATVTLCHTRTLDPAAIAREADIVVVATGRRNSLGAEGFRPGQAVVDVGFHQKEDGSFCGDADFEAAMEVCDWVTPVPGGVGAVTTALLALHTVEAAERAAD